MNDAATVEEFKKNDENVRLEVETPNELSKQKAKEILKDKVELEQESEARLSNIPKPQNQMDAQKI